MNEHPVDPPREVEGVSRTRFVTACQQLLVLAVVATVLTPAARTISLDILPSGPGDAPVGSAVLGNAVSTVPAGKVEASGKEIPLTAKRGVRARVAGSAAATRQRIAKGERVQTNPVTPDGYALIGVTWDSATPLEEGEISFALRTREDGQWSGWNDVPYHDEHGPDPESAEASAVRPGSDAIVVGDVDQVQMRIDTVGKAPADMRLAVIDPGETEETAEETPEIDTAALETESPGGDLQLAAGTTPKPRIFSRAQWGANEEIRDRSSLSYYEVHTGFVHHTVSANSYSRSDVPSMIRGIYHYHVKNRGWSDIGYNFLVDRFGRIWEGRAGGVDRPVVGAHTYGYNDMSFAMSAIGNFETALPTQRMIDAYAQLFGWKLSLHGVKATKPRALRMNGRIFPAINGHRDAGATACPGQHLYDRLGDIRTMAKQYQAGWRGRQLESNLAADRRPDLIMRRQSDGRGFVLPLKKYRDGTYGTGRMIDTGLDLSNARDVLKVGDWDGDGHGDLIIRYRRDGRLFLFRGMGTGKFEDGVIIARRMRAIARLAAVGDFDGDGRPDLVGQPRNANATMLYPGRGLNGVAARQVMYRPVSLLPVGVGRWNGDGAPDVLHRNRHELYVYYGNGPGGYAKRRKLDFNISRFSGFVGVHNLGMGGHVDIVARERGTAQLYFIPARYKRGGTFKADPIPLGRSVEGFNKIG